MAIELITGRYGTAHIGSEDVRAYQAYTAGSGRYVLHGGGATIQSANDVHLNPAEILIDGAHVRITGQGEDVTLDNGASSYNRVDIVALRYLMTGSGDSAVESITLEVVKGTPSELTPSDPSMPASGSILDNVSETYVPYVRVLIQGLTPQTPEVLLPGYVNPADIAGDGDQVDPSVLVNLGSGDADTIYKASPRPGITGTLAVAHGGTGATSASAIKSSTLGVMKHLWSGSWSSGSISVNEFSSYRLFLITATSSDGATYKPETLLGWSDPATGQLRAVSMDTGGTDNTEDLRVSGFRCAVRGNTLTTPQFTRVQFNGGYVFSFGAVTNIYGLI